MLGDAAFNNKEDILYNPWSGGSVYVFPGIYEQIEKPSDFKPQNWIFLYQGSRALRSLDFSPGEIRLEGDFRILNIGDKGKDNNDVLY